MSDPGLRRSPHNFRRASAPELPRASLRPSAFRPFVRNALLLLSLLFLLTACGRRPGQPTPLPPGTRVVQPTPDFSAPAQADTATQTSDQVADSLRTRLARQQAALTATPVPTGDASPDPTQSVLSANPSLAVFSRPTALGILSGGGLLYSAPGRGAHRRHPPGRRHPHHHRPFRRPRLVRRLPRRRRPPAGSPLPKCASSATPTSSKSSRNPSALPSSPPSSPKPANPQDPNHHRHRPPHRHHHRIPQSAPQPPQITGPAVTVIVEGANVRTGPGTDFPVVAGLYQDESSRPPRPQPNRRLAPNPAPPNHRLDLRPTRPNHRPHRRPPPHRPAPPPHNPSRPSIQKKINIATPPTQNKELQ